MSKVTLLRLAGLAMLLGVIWFGRWAARRNRG